MAVSILSMTYANIVALRSTTLGFAGLFGYRSSGEYIDRRGRHQNEPMPFCFIFSRTCLRISGFVVVIAVSQAIGTDETRITGPSADGRRFWRL